MTELEIMLSSVSVAVGCVVFVLGLGAGYVAGLVKKTLEIREIEARAQKLAEIQKERQEIAKEIRELQEAVGTIKAYQELIIEKD